MPFPAKNRVVFGKNPLDQVICQIRFPPILKIDTEVPADFQERIRQEFPEFSEKIEINLDLTHDKNSPISSEMIPKVVKAPGTKNYEFSSEDNIWKINLTRNFVALSTSHYERWELFKGKLVPAFQALQDIYKPSHISRIGLRYIDVIQRSSLNLGDTHWRELLNPSLLGLIGDTDVGDSVLSFNNKYEIRLTDNKSIVKIITSLVTAKDNNEICYMIDSDFFIADKIAIEETIPKLDFFNSRASRLIQWCISDQLFNAMEPQNI